MSLNMIANHPPSEELNIQGWQISSGGGPELWGICKVGNAMENVVERVDEFVGGHFVDNLNANFTLLDGPQDPRKNPHRIRTWPMHMSKFDVLRSCEATKRQNLRHCEVAKRTVILRNL